VNSFGAIFDWDGVIIDSSRQHEISWNMIAAEIGRELPENFFKKSFGMKNPHIISRMLEWADKQDEITQLGNRKEELYREIIVKDGIEPLAGVREFLDSLKEGNIPCAVASSTPRENIDCIIDTLGFGEYFSEIISADDVLRGKPDPEVFLLAGAHLGYPPNRCVVFEDAHVGIDAARAAGMKVVAVETTHPADTLMEADNIVKRLDELSIAELSGWINGGNHTNGK
jgi:beta-phosphoglucomutase family hydrolase